MKKKVCTTCVTRLVPCVKMISPIGFIPSYENDKPTSHNLCGARDPSSDRSQNCRRLMNKNVPMAQSNPHASDKPLTLSALDLKKYNQLAEHMEYYVRT